MPLTGCPSSVTDTALTPLTKSAARPRQNPEPNGSVWPQKPTLSKPMKLATGKKSDTPCGIEQSRVALPPKNAPPRNQSEPRWPTMQSAPVASFNGLTSVGIESAHCHHCGVNC